MNKVSKNNFKQDSYKYGFVTDIESETIPRGLNEDIVRIISNKKNEPKWMLEWRLKAFHRLKSMKIPKWAKVEFEDIDLVMCYFTATWCGPCKHISPTVENIGQNNSHIKVLKIDVNECEDVSENYEIECMPTFKFFKPGELESIHTFSGASDEELLNTISAN